MTSAMVSDPQTSNAVLLVRPAGFGFHAEAARSNAFAGASADPDVAACALGEFDALALRLEHAGIEPIILDDLPEPARPDAIFPNNWVSFHADGTIVLYPMATAARRIERRTAELEALLTARGFEIRRTIDLSGHEHAERFLEGTGSMVLDRPRRQAFASLSARTHRDAVAAFDRELGYSTTLFEAFDRAGQPIYHTNVLMSLGASFAILCRDAIAPADRERVMAAIEASGRETIAVEADQMERFVCNILELRGTGGAPVIAMSAAALASLRPEQRRRLERHGALLDCAIPTIEAVGGGSVRCMIAEVFLPRSR